MQSFYSAKGVQKVKEDSKPSYGKTRLKFSNISTSQKELWTDIISWILARTLVLDSIVPSIKMSCTNYGNPTGSTVLLLACSSVLLRNYQKKLPFLIHIFDYDQYIKCAAKEGSLHRKALAT
jgi:hypothetical protein